MADFQLAVASHAAAVTTDATRWRNVVLGAFLIVDGRTPAVVAAATRWFNAALSPDSGQLQGQVWTVYTLIYKMRGRDAATDDLDTWLSSGQPDFGASRYAGALAMPLRDVVIVDVWLAA
jgi:hypothetical protein